MVTATTRGVHFLPHHEKFRRYLQVELEVTLIREAADGIDSSSHAAILGDRDTCGINGSK
jgi:hypothetical protein